MADECRVDVDAMTNDQHEIQLTDNQGTKLETESNAQEISSYNDQANDVINEDIVQEREDKWLLDLLVIKGKKLIKESGTQFEQDYKIGWFPQILWQNYEYCRPRELSIGPCAYEGDYIYSDFRNSGRIENLRVKNGELKVELAAKFIKSFSDDKTGGSLLNEIRNNVQDLSKCFSNWHHYYSYDVGTLARLLFLEGCAVLEFIHSYLLNELEEFGINNHQASFIREDLFLFENQIPFQVLELLINSTSNPDQLKTDIVNFLHLNNMMAPMDDMCRHKQWNDILKIKDKNVHLLDLLHSVIISGYDDVSTDNNFRYLPCCYNQQKNNCCLPLFSCFHRKRQTLKDPLLAEHPNYDNKRFFRNVQELKSAGIEFKPCSSLATISFSSKCFNIRGHLKLPSLTVDEWTERRLMNLVAHEACLRGNCKKNQYAVTSYVKFMDFLIDKEQDVKELRASRVLWNRLSSDVDVAKLFNKIGSTCFEPPQDAYLDVKTKIQTHCERKCTIWMAQVYQEHFSSPWTIVALLAAGLVISLTFVQTWYAVHPKN